MKSLGEQVLLKFRMGDFTGIRKLVEWMSPSHAKWIDDFMPNTSVIGPKGKGMRIKNLLKLTLGSLQAVLFTLPGKVLSAIPNLLKAIGKNKMLALVVGTLAAGMTGRYLYRLLTEILGNPIAQIIQNGKTIYEDSGPFARDLFKEEDSKIDAIATALHKEMDKSWYQDVNEEYIATKLRQTGSRFALAQLAHVWEKKYSIPLHQSLSEGTSMVLSLEKYKFWDDTDDYASVLRELVDMKPVKWNEKNKEVFDGLIDIMDIPQDETFMYPGPIIIENGAKGAYYRKGLYPPATILFRLGEYFYTQDPNYDDGQFKKYAKALSEDEFNAAISADKDLMNILKGKVKLGKFQPDVKPDDFEKEYMKNNIGDIKADFQKTI